MTIEGQHFGLTPAGIGGAFMLAAAIQLVASSLWGMAIAKVKYEQVFALTGQIIAITASMLSGPMWPIPFVDSIPLILVRQVLLGLSQGPIFTASVTVGQKEMIRSGFCNNLSLIHI